MTPSLIAYAAELTLPQYMYIHLPDKLTLAIFLTTHIVCVNQAEIVISQLNSIPIRKISLT